MTRRRAGATPRTPIVSVAGPSGAGKTTLLAALLRALAARGVRAAVAKHTPHAHALDLPGKDTDVLRRAGAAATALVGPEGTAVIGPPLAHPRELLRALPPVDLLLLEGWRSAPVPRVEVHRRSVARGFLSASDPRVLAAVSDEPPPAGVAWLAPGDADGLADLLCARFGLRRGGRAERLPARSPVRRLPRGEGAGRADASGRREPMARKTTTGGAARGGRARKVVGARKPKARAGTRSRSEAGRKGGQATLRRRGPEFYSEIGRKGGRRRGARARAAAAKRPGRRSAGARSAGPRSAGRGRSRSGSRRGR